MSANGSSSGQRLRRGLWIAVGIAAVAGLAIYLGELRPSNWRAGSGGSGFVVSEPFSLTSHKGEKFSSDSLRGRPYLVFFGFTHCPDICPTTLQEVSTHLADLGAKADQITPLFITVDPARDTVENLASYLSSFDGRIIGLTGSEDEIKKVTKLFRAFYEKVDASGDSDDYSMNHTASVYLFDGRGRLASTLSWQEKASTRQAKLEKVLSK